MPVKKGFKNVLVAMSGGVDSSVAALLLKKKGYNVAGVFMKLWPEGSCSENKCCSSEGETGARLVAKQLNIPFYVLNFEKDFKNKIVDYFLKEQKAGLTPNPCVICNKEIKFNLLFKKFPIKKNDFIATGHYARLKKGKLYMAKDKAKDQSYFLWMLNQKILKKSLFPNGDYTKKEIRAIAKKHSLSVWDSAESQDVCFKVKLNKKPGPIVLRQGANYRVIGQHKGLWFYTIGQRKGIGLAAGPYYVLRKDIKKNALIVTKKEKDLFSKELKFKEPNWIFEKPSFPLKIKAKIRYRHKPISAVLYLPRGKAGKDRVVFSKPQRAPTPGQSVVFYLPASRQAGLQEVLGGGIII
ncbi:hypothetical protein AMJ47_02345 [Parcubacteria bacterium DG_72]|nr:MAG: hypothetical protein AMJ47_02345 [Parcubacteria bacterium DG_72]